MPENGESNTKAGAEKGLLHEQITSIVLFVCVGPALIFLNRYLLVEQGFKFPGMLTAMGMIAAMIFSHTAASLGKLELEHKETMSLTFYLRRIMPIGFAQAGTIISGNLAYLTLSVAFIQILKAFAPVMLVAVLLFSRMEEPKFLLLTSVAVISIGCMGAVQGELKFDYFGFWIMMLSEFIEAIKLVCQQQLVGNLKFSVLESLYWMSPAGVFWLLTYSFFFERAEMARVGALGIFMSNLGLFMCAALLGLAVNYCGWRVSKCCSALTLKITSIARNIGLVLASPLLLGETVTSTTFLWYLVSTCGIGLYQYIRMYPEVTEVYTLKWLSQLEIFHRGTPSHGNNIRLLLSETRNKESEEV